MSLAVRKFRYSDSPGEAAEVGRRTDVYAIYWAHFEHVAGVIANELEKIESCFIGDDYGK